MLNILSQLEVRKIIAAHLFEKPDVFALKFYSQQYPVAILATQLKYLQRSKDKLPTLFGVQAIIPALSYEQCSSEEAAALKQISGERILDLTAGLGIDTMYFAKQATEVVAVEKNAELLAITKYNFSLLDIRNVHFVNDSAEHFLQNYAGEKFDWIFIDPARRGDEGGKVFLPEDLQPNIFELLPHLEQKCHRLMVKMSPLYDVEAALQTFPTISEFQVVSIDNECKELLLIWDFSNKKPLKQDEIPLIIITSNKKNTQIFRFKREAQKSNAFPIIYPSKYIYDPNVAFYKSRLTSELFTQYFPEVPFIMTNRYGFFLSDTLITDFPGRIFQIKAKISYKPKKLISFLKENHVFQANILQRCFPFAVSDIRKSLKIKEGGNDFLICTVLNENEKTVFWANKI